MPLMLKRVRDAMRASGAAHAAPSAAAAPERPPVTPSGDAPTPSTSDLEISGVVSDPPKAPVQTMPPTPTPVEPLPVDVHPKPDTERDTRSSDHVELHPTHPWFTHHPNSSPVSFAKKYPPTGVTPHSTEWVYAYSLSPQGAPVPPASEGNFSGKWMVMCVPSNELDTKWQQVCAAVEAGEVSAAKVVPGGEAHLPQSRGTPIIAYTNDFRNQTDVLRAGLALRKRFGDLTKLMYKPDVFTLCDQERLFTVGPRGGKKPVPKCPYLLTHGLETLKVVAQSLSLAKEMAVEPWAKNVSEDVAEQATLEAHQQNLGSKDKPIEL